MPFRIDILDPAFRSAEPSGYYAAPGGKATVVFELAENERIGLWSVAVTERLTGLTQTVYMKVQ